MAEAPEGQSCATCLYSMPSARVGIYKLFCRRYPRQVCSAQDGTPDYYPAHTSNDWCGEYRPANPETVSEGMATVARFVLLGDLTAARALNDRLKEEV